MPNRRSLEHRCWFQTPRPPFITFWIVFQFPRLLGFLNFSNSLPSFIPIPPSIRHLRVSVEPNDLQACHCMRKKDRVIIKFKFRKQKHRVILNRKTLHNKSLDLTRLKFSGKLFVNESMCHENHQLAYKCRQLKSARKIHSTWFYNSTLHIKLVENGPIHKIFHTTDIEVLGVDNLDEYINNVSS